MIRFPVMAMKFGMDLAFGILEENEENADRVLDIQQYVNRQNKSVQKEIYESSGDSGTRNRK